MKLTFCVLFVLLVYVLPAQDRAANFSNIGWEEAPVAATTPEALSRQLTIPYKTDLEKVRAIFRWITENIAYQVRPRTTLNRSALRYKPVTMDSLLALKPVDEIVAYTVLQQRTALCNGYARLFKTLCEYAGIRSVLVTGYARTNWGSRQFRSNHTWSAVYIDSAWHLVDVTWASGFISFADEFVKYYDESYFFPNPASFINTHYPEDLQWALIPNPPALYEFKQAPFRLTAYIKYGIASYAPVSGVLEAAVGDTLHFRIDLKDKTSFDMAPEPGSDSMQLSGVPSWDFVKPTISGKQAFYTYVVPSDQIEWVHLVFNDDVILRYRLNVRKPKPEL